MVVTLQKPSTSLRRPEGSTTWLVNGQYIRTFLNSLRSSALHRNPHAFGTNRQRWWTATAPHLSGLLSEAGYTIESRKEALAFYYNFITPSLGPFPDSTQPSWNSFMTDDFTPIEYSWKWSNGSLPPDIRYSVEAISHLAGTEVDPSNQIATCNLLSQLAMDMPKLNLTLFRHMWPRLVGADSPSGKEIDDINSAQSTLFVAFEIGRNGDPGVKIYFIPRPTFESSAAKQMFDAIRSLDYMHLQPILHLESFLSDDWAGKTIMPFMLGIDGVTPLESRLKVYSRSHVTSFSFVQYVMSFGGQRKRCGSEEEQLKDIWYRTLGLSPNFPISQELPTSDHQTAGVLFYFDIGPKTLIPDVKVYIPVRHYAQSDLQITESLVEFQQEHGRGKYSKGYTRVIEKMAARHGIESGTGVHTYVAVSYSGNTLAITSYLNPQIYHRRNSK